MVLLVEEFRTLLSMRKRDTLSQLALVGVVLCSALMLWKMCLVVSGSDSPIVVVLSGSMEPGYERGDLLLLTMWSDPIRVGEVVVFKQDDREVPIVHRVHRVHVRASDGEVFILTKGDNNPHDDRALYRPGTEWVRQRELMGRARAYLPYVGMLTIWMTETPALKVIVVAGLVFFLLTGKGEE